jgi:hypothetical protein
MKMRSPHIVPLAKQSLEVLDTLRMLSGDSEWLFPGDRNAKKPMSNNTILKALERMGYKGRMTGHGFRGLASTILHERGYNHEHIELQLAHTPRNAVSAAYNHALYLQPRTKMMGEWADFLEQAQRGGGVLAFRPSPHYAFGTSCPTSRQNGNFVGANASLAPLANYGGPTQTQPPLPGSPAICEGLIADIPAGVTTDQRGLSRTTTYGSNPPCVDSGSVQTNYSLAFRTEPPASVPPSVNFTAALQLSESGNPFPVSGVTVPLALASGNPGSLNVSTLNTNTSGIAGSSTLQVGAEGTGDMLVATLPLTTTPPPAPLTTPLSITATSIAFNVAQGAQTITFSAPASPVTYGVGPIALSASASSGLPVTFSVMSGPAALSGSTLTITGTGTIVVAANQAGNASYLPAPQVTQTIMVNKATQSLSVAAAPVSPVYGTLITFTGMPAPAGTIAANFSFVIDKGTANLAILPAAVVTNATVTATYGQLKAGAHTVELDFSGMANYAASASPSVAVNVSQATPAITWNPATSIPYGTTASALLDATANIPGAFTYTAKRRAAV